jgi:hypothetical protein
VKYPFDDREVVKEAFGMNPLSNNPKP